MANPEHVERLKQGVAGWNAWRAENFNMRPDLREVDLREVDLSGADLHDADLRDATLSEANLSEAHLSEANLSNANLGGADLRSADLRDANLSHTNLLRACLSGTHLSCVNLSDADLRYTDLSDANLNNADLRGADLSHANLRSADLRGADLTDADLGGANLHDAIVDDTVFARVDLREVKGLTQINHQGPSRVALHTIQLLQDGSALHFLRGTGTPDEWMDFWRSTMMYPIQYHSLFISYSSKDEVLAHRLHADLQAHGVRCWFAPEDMKIGNKIRQRIDEAIHLQDKLLLLLSEHAIASTWVENEVEAALEKETRQSREVLFPVRLDNMVMQTSMAWAATLHRTRHIGDFTAWMDPHAYQSAFERLLRDLKQS